MNDKLYTTGVIFVHGIQGKPSQFDFLVKQLPDDRLIRNILLPGHGATTGEFRKATSAQWLDAVREESLSMRRRCDRLVFVGHSMGCLLGLLLQQERKLFSAMLLICCPFCLRPTVQYFRNSIAATFIKRETSDPYVKAARNANGVFAKNALSYLFCAKPYFELLGLIQSVRKTPPSVPELTVFCYSQRDEIVGARSVFYARDHFDAKIVVYAGCGHNYFTPAAQKRLSEQLLKITGNNMIKQGKTAH